MFMRPWRAVISVSLCLPCSLGCIIVGTTLVEHRYGVSAPSAADDSAIGLMMLFALLPEMLVGLTLGLIVAAAVLRWLGADARRRRLALLREYRRSRTSPSGGVWPPRPAR